MYVVGTLMQEFQLFETFKNLLRKKEVIISQGKL